jgi:hypothetical protein
VYKPVPRGQILDSLVHIRELHRRVKPTSEREQLLYERREAATRDLLSNLPRLNEHPTLKTLFEIADVNRLTLDGVHRLFGYELDRIRDLDLQLNGDRTHIFESYAFERDRLIDLPSRLAPRESFVANALMRDLVADWQTEIPIRTLDGRGWRRPGTFYVHIGTEDSLGAGIPPGALALIQPVEDEEKLRPNPRAIYLLQFGNGYRCSRCVVTRGKLRLFTSMKVYLGSQEFLYPGEVRIAGRIRMFAVNLPVPEYPSLRSLPPCSPCAELVLPWEQLSRDRLLATEHKRFKRPKEAEQSIREFLRNELNAKLSGRSERRYRRPSKSEPHVNALIHLSLAHVARYTDSLRAGGSWISDNGRFSLENLLNASRLEDLSTLSRDAHLPEPREVWEARLKEFVEWPPLLSLKFPQLRFWDDRVMRLSDGNAIHALDPPLTGGSWLLLEKVPTIPDIGDEKKQVGWSRPIYILRKGFEVFCGYLEQEAHQYVLVSGTHNPAPGLVFPTNEFSQLNRVAGAAVPV